MVEEKGEHGKQKEVYMENLRRGVYIQESIHKKAYWKRRESIEKKPSEYVYSAGKEQTERGQRKSCDTLSVLKGQDEQKGRTSNIVTTESKVILPLIKIDIAIT